MRYNSGQRILLLLRSIFPFLYFRGGDEGGSKGKNDREYKAVSLNLREDRILQTTMQTLSLEQTYAMKLLELDNRQINLRHKRLKSRVSKIKSHLTPDQIIKMRRLEEEGKLNLQNTGLQVSSAIRIAAAAKRLNLGSERKRALYEHKKRQQQLREELQTDDDEEADYMESKTDDIHTGFHTLTRGLLGKHNRWNYDDGPRRPMSGISSMVSTRRNMLPLRPATSNGFATQKTDAPRRIKSANLYSSHKGSKSSKQESRSPQSQRRRRNSGCSEISLGSNAAKNEENDKIEDLLDEEEMKTVSLTHRKHEFITSIDRWVSEAPTEKKPQNFENSLDTCLTQSGGISRLEITKRAKEAQKKIDDKKREKSKKQFTDGLRKMTLVSTMWGVTDDKKQNSSTSDVSNSEELKHYQILLDYEDEGSRLYKKIQQRNKHKTNVEVPDVKT